MKVLDLFSGIGGFSLGLEWAGMSTVAMCEKDPYCRKILAKHWPDLPIHEDIRNLDGQEFAGTIDVVCGGFPCQPFSVAGARRGKDDDRHLWPEMLRVIQEVKPRWVIGENVFGFLNMALDDVQSDLEREHYEVRKFVLPAVAVDAQHRRDRVFVIAYSNSNVIRNKPRWGNGENRQGSSISTDHGEAQSMADTHSEGQLQQARTEQEVGGWSSNSGQKDVANAQHTGPQGRLCGRSDQKRQSQLGHTGCGSTAHRQPIEEGWCPEPDVGRVAHGVPSRVDRLKGLGNAVVPQLIQAIGEIVIKADREIYNVES